MADLLLKQCCGCREMLPRSMFHRRTASKDGLQLYCKQCAKGRLRRWQIENADKMAELNRVWNKSHAEMRKAYKEAYRAKNKQQAEERRILRTYGLSPEEYNQIIALQDAKCAICKSHTKLCIDHCHGTNIVRGLLCHPCNTALGLFRDDPAILGQAAEYLKGFAYAQSGTDPA